MGADIKIEQIKKVINMLSSKGVSASELFASFMVFKSNGLTAVEVHKTIEMTTGEKVDSGLVKNIIM